MLDSDGWLGLDLAWPEMRNTLGFLLGCQAAAAHAGWAAPLVPRPPHAAIGSCPERGANESLSPLGHVAQVRPGSGKMANFVLTGDVVHDTLLNSSLIYLSIWQQKHAEKVACAHGKRDIASNYVYHISARVEV